MSRGAAQRIEQFLKDNKDCELYVVVGYVSAYGPGWLNDRTQGQKVNLLIGDTRQGFGNTTEKDRQKALRFMSRPNVSVKNWYSKKGGGSIAHSKTYIAVKPLPGSKAKIKEILIGSANLTKNGLHNNYETMAGAAKSEYPDIWNRTSGMFRNGWDAASKINQKLEYRPNRHTPKTRTKHPQKHLRPVRPTSARPSGKPTENRNTVAMLILAVVFPIHYFLLGKPVQGAIFWGSVIATSILPPPVSALAAMICLGMYIYGISKTSSWTDEANAR